MYKTRKIASAAVAAVLVAGLSLSPAVSLAQTQGGNDVADAPVTITGVNDGDTVNFYQVFDADIDASNNLTYTTKVAGLPDAYDTAAEVAGKDGRTVADAIAPIVTKGTATHTATAADGKVTQGLDSGLYLVTVTTTSGATKVYQTMLVDASPVVKDGKYAAATLQDQAAKSQDVPAPEKKVVSANGTTSGNLTDTYSVGDVATFQIDATIPSFPADATHATFALTDKPEAGLKVDQNSVKVFDGVDLKNPVEASNYTIVPKGGSFTVEFKWDYLKTRGAQKVRVEYQAEVVAINNATGKVGNKAYGTFTPNPYDNTTVDTKEVDPQIQTYGFTFQKFGGTDADKAPLKDAEFTICLKGTNVPVTYIDAAGTKHTDGKVKSDAKGFVYVNGLKAGTYTVTETGVPAGFQKIPDFELTLNEVTASGDSNATPTVTEENFADAGEKVDPKQGELPTTGGAGTVAFTAGGILLIAGGAVVVFRSRKRD
ncbi:MAG: SpaH/EbpB family LPXTG-anchored major pilin [Collinsella sp.]